MPTFVSQMKTAANGLAAELVFAQAGKDNGLLPINCLLLSIEEAAADPAVPASLAQGIQSARKCLDDLFEASGTFDSFTIAYLATWVGWLQDSLTAIEAGASLPQLPGSEEPPLDDAATPPAPIQTPKSSQETLLALNLEEDAELLREFINEATEHLQNIEEGVLTLEESPSDPDTLNSIFRAFHTFKGGAGFLNLRPIHDVAHELESLLDLARQHKITINRDIIDIILEGGDLLKRYSGEISARLAGADNSKPIALPTLGLIHRIRALLNGDHSPMSPSAPPEAEAAHDGPPESSSHPAPEHPDSAGTAARKGESATAVKVDTQKLDGLIDAVGELVIAQSLVVQNPALKAIQNEQLTRNLAELARITKDLQRTAMSLRMMPIRSTFQKMQRLVRDVTAKVGKKIHLVTDGEETELDRGIVEQLNDPLIHMIRNSLDHGIESPEVRVAAGKPEQGTVSLRAYHQGGNIVIEIKDDGKGLDCAAILAKAREKGIVGPDEELSEQEIFGLIFAPGFSTAAKVTELSGRGVGMDVVRRNVEKLRGKIEVKSKMGEGATFSIFLPLTLAIIDGLLVSIAEQRYILPTLSVIESFRLVPDAVKTIQGRGEVVSVRGRLRPLLRLREHLGMESSTCDSGESIAVVVQSSNDARCVLVDKLLGKQEVVIKSLGECFHSNPYVAGAAILGDGRVGLILDAEALVGGHTAAKRSRANAHSNATVFGS
jgi:two-component system, chemotaxis family, sensor kinase CheA